MWTRLSLYLAFFAVTLACCQAQMVNAPSAEKQADHPSASEQQLPVNWLYGAYVPTEAPLEALSDADRWKLFVRMSFTTPGIYIKTGFFTVSDQVSGAPAGWPQNAEGFGNRLGNRYAQFLMQNSFTAIGDAMAGWEPRYDRCRNCEGVGQRVKHTIIRNFGGAALSSYWQPYRPNPVVKGYQGVATQAWVGIVINMVGEFAPDIKHAIHRNKKNSVATATEAP